MNLALRHPQLFLQGRGAERCDTNLTRPVGPFEEPIQRTLRPGRLLHYSDPLSAHLNDPGLLEPMRRMHITLAVGEKDPFHESNCLLSHALGDKGVPHRLATWPGEAHRARYWREMVPHYL